MPRRRPDPDEVERWMTFLRNHKDGIAAMDFFIVPTIRLRVLYASSVIEHARRRVLHFNATFNPTSAWVIQQLREAFPYEAAPRYLIFDRDSIFSAAVIAFVKAMGAKPCRTAYRSPWQGPVAERWIGGARRELFDHVVVFNERHAVHRNFDSILPSKRRGNSAKRIPARSIALVAKGQVLQDEVGA